MDALKVAVVNMEAAESVVGEVLQVLRSMPDLRVDVMPAQEAVGVRLDLIVMCCGTGALNRAPMYVAQCRGRDAQRHVLMVGAPACERELGSLLKIGLSDFVRLPLVRAELHTRVERALGLYPCGLSHPHSQWLIADEPMLCSVSARVNAQLARIPMLAGGPQHVIVVGEAGCGRRAFVRQLVRLSSRPTVLELDPKRVPVAQMEAALERAVAEVDDGAGAIVIAHDIEWLPAPVQTRLLHLMRQDPHAPGGIGRLFLTAGDAPRAERSSLCAAMVALDGAARVRIPPLRERREDALPLARLLIARRCAQLDRPVPALTPAAARFLLTHPWPGNVHELRARVHHALQHALGDVLGADDLQSDFTLEQRVPESSLRQAKTQLIVSFERTFLEQLLESCQGNIAKAARLARKNRRALFELIRKHNIDVDRYRVTALTRS